MKPNTIIINLLLLAGFFATVNIHAQVGPVTIGTFPKNKTLTIQYRATIANPLPSGTTQVSHQGTVSGTNLMAPVLTDDPDAPGTADPTVTLIDLPPSVTAIVRLTPLLELTNATGVTFRVTFSEAVTGVDAADFEISTTSGTVSTTVSTVTDYLDGHTVYDVLVTPVTGNGVIRLDLKASGTGIQDSGGNGITGGFTSGQTYTIDQTAPVLSPVSITSNNANSALYAKVGDKVTVAFTASETIATPTVTIAGQTATVSNVSGNQWKGEFIMTASQAEGLVPFTINFTDNAGNAGTQVTAVSDASSVTFDKTAPTGTFIERFDPLAATTSGTSVIFRITFSEAVSGVDASDFTLGGAVTGSIGTVTVVSGSDGTQYDIPVNNLTGTGSFGVGLKSSGTGIVDVAGNALSSIIFPVQTYNRVNAPTVTSITRYTPLNQLTNTSLVIYEVVFSNSVTGVDAVDFTLYSPDGVTGTVSQISGSGTTYQVQVSGITGNGSLRLDVKDDGTTGIKDANNTDLLGGFSSGETYTIDHLAPTLTSVVIVSSNANYAYAKVDDVVTVNFTSSEAIQTPNATIATHNATITPLGGNDYKATYTMGIADLEGGVPFSISFSDLAGNAGTNVTATTNSSSVTFDRTLPTLTSVHIQSGNSNDTLAKIPDLITLSFTSSEPILGTTVTIAGHAATISSAGGNSYTATHNVVAGDADGRVTFSISGFKDNAGNAGVTVTATTDGSFVSIDKIAPTLSSVTIASTNTNTAYAKSGDKITLLFTASETIQTPAVSLFGHSVTPTNEMGNQWKAEYTTLATDAEGPVQFLVSSLQDLAGNNGMNVSTTNNSSSVIFDKTAPLITNCSGDLKPTVGSGCTASPTWTVPTATDANVTGSLNAYEHTGGDPNTAFNVGSYTIVYKFKDPAGNESNCTFTVTVEDKSAPTFSTSLSANPVVLWPPDHKLKTITLTYDTQDNCSGTVTNNITVTSTDPISGVSDGDKFPDWIVINDRSVQLRAERGNGKEARVYTITVTPVDAYGNTGIPQSVNVVIAHNITAPLTGSSFKVGSTVAFSGAFWDKPANKHTGQWLIDDNTIVKGTITEPSGTKNGKLTGSYKFASAGVYRLQMNITDQYKVTSYCNTNEDMEEIVVIYDPNGGYTYGGGWFPSPAGALKSDPTATGKGNFGFSINYYKGATYPKGETQFDFKVGDLQYNALNFDYLSISGARAQFRGTGRIIGGQSGINFIMTVIDGALDGTGVDKVRLKIYNKNTSEVYYDSQPGASDAANPTIGVGANSDVVIGGTSMLTRWSAPAETTVTSVGALDVRVYPNPTSTRFTLKVSSDNVEEGINLVVTDLLGRVVEVRRVAADQSVNLGTSYRPGVYLARVLQGKEHKEIKLVKLPD